ncbi:hypothetical protein BgiBS90_019826, partial [Biomphalaria glabrata]
MVLVRLWSSSCAMMDHDNTAIFLHTGPHSFLNAEVLPGASTAFNKMPMKLSYFLKIFFRNFVRVWMKSPGSE